MQGIKYSLKYQAATSNFPTKWLICQEKYSLKYIFLKNITVINQNSYTLIQNPDWTLLMNF